MEETTQALTQADIISLIYGTMNALFSNLFSSIDNTIYNLLDDIVFLSSDNLITSSIKSLFFSSKFNILILANILISALIIYKVIHIVLNMYAGKEPESLYGYIIKVIIYTILLNNSLFIIEQILNINSLVTQYLIELGEYLFSTNISFISFISIINEHISDSNTFDIFSINGIIKSIATFSLFSLLISYMLRYILIKLLIICSPFAFICLIEDNLVPYFKNWFKYLFSLAITQNLIIIVLYIPYILNFDNSIYSKFLLIATIYTLYQLNSYIKDFLGGFSLSNDFSSIISKLGGK